VTLVLVVMYRDVQLWTYRAPRRSYLERSSQPINCITALGASFVKADLADAVEDFDHDALLGEARKEAADRVRRPAHRLGDLRSASNFVTVLRILLAPASLMP
jgi:hypothetical protein